MRKIIDTFLVGQLHEKKRFNTDTQEWEEQYLATDVKKHIYEVDNPNINTNKLVQGQRYLIEYRFRNKAVSDYGVLLQSSKDFRTLWFTHPTDVTKTIGIPLMNIINLTELE